MQGAKRQKASDSKGAVVIEDDGMETESSETTVVPWSYVR